MKTKNLFAVLLVVVLCLCLLTACADKPEQVDQAEPVDLYVAAAASLTDVMTEIGTNYKTFAPDVNVIFTFDASGKLQTQIEEGAPADVFVSAAQKQMKALNEKGLVVADSIKNLLINKVVLIVPASAQTELTSFEDVATDKVSMVAIGDPASVPAGQYAEEAFTSLGIWDNVLAKANLGSDVRAVLSWVETGEVECGVVYATDAASTDDVTVICEAPAGSHKQITYPAAIITASQQLEAAQAFIDYLSSDAAASSFKNAGFTMYTAE